MGTGNTYRKFGGILIMVFEISEWIDRQPDTQTCSSQYPATIWGKGKIMIAKVSQ